MAGPSWVADIFAAVIILAAAYSVGRLAASRLRWLVIEADTDGLHVLMGTVMAGMLVPQLSLLPGRVWAVAFGSGAAWFAGCALRAGAPAMSSWRCRYPVPHMIECIAMLYMLLAMPRAQHGAVMSMPGMSVPSGGAVGFPALAEVLALFMLGYLLWTADQLTTLARARVTTERLTRIPEHPVLVTVPADGGPASMPSAVSMPGASPNAGQNYAANHVHLAPGLAAVSKIAMSITMGYMLLLMI